MGKTYDTGALTFDEGQENDYTLSENFDSVWVTVDGFNIKISRRTESTAVDGDLFVDVWETKKELDNPIQSLVIMKGE